MNDLWPQRHVCVSSGISRLAPAGPRGLVQLGPFGSDFVWVRSCWVSAGLRGGATPPGAIHYRLCGQLPWQRSSWSMPRQRTLRRCFRVDVGFQSLCLHPDDCVKNLQRFSGDPQVFHLTRSFLLCRPGGVHHLRSRGGEWGVAPPALQQRD